MFCLIAVPVKILDFSQISSLQLTELMLNYTGWQNAMRNIWPQAIAPVLG